MTPASRYGCFNEAAGIPRGRRLREVMSTCLEGPGFNEAAGIPRGRRSGRRARNGRSTRFNEAAGIPRGRRAVPMTPASRYGCFNEAAGIPRGRRLREVMSTCLEGPGFNEAAGIPRGRLVSVAPARSGSWRFNEAAGIPRGRPPLPSGPYVQITASMRPRVFPAEDAAARLPPRLELELLQ